MRNSLLFSRATVGGQTGQLRAGDRQLTQFTSKIQCPNTDICGARQLCSQDFSPQGGICVTLNRALQQLPVNLYSAFKTILYHLETVYKEKVKEPETGFIMAVGHYISVDPAKETRFLSPCRS